MMEVPLSPEVHPPCSVKQLKAFSTNYMTRFITGAYTAKEIAMPIEEYATIHDLFPWIVYDDDPISILIVEDDIFMQAQFASLIKATDYEVSIEKVTTAEEAEQLLDGKNCEHFDLVIADQFLEGRETGLDLWRFCQKSHPDVRFLLTSGEQLKNFLNEIASNCGIPDFLSKPFSPKQALEKISRSLKATDTAKILTAVKERDSIEVSLPGQDLRRKSR